MKTPFTGTFNGAKGPLRRPWTKPALAAALAVALVAGSGIGEALSYFTTYVEASGGHVIELKKVETEPEETFDRWTKHVVVTNNVTEGAGQACFVRLRAFAGGQVKLTYSDSDGQWSPRGDGWYYYMPPVEPGASTGPIDIKIELPGAEFTDDFNVTVVYETVPAKGAASADAADWNGKVDKVSATY